MVLLGLFTSLFATLALIFFLAKPMTMLYATFGLPIGRLYSNVSSLLIISSGPAFWRAPLEDANGHPVMSRRASWTFVRARDSELHSIPMNDTILNLNTQLRDLEIHTEVSVSTDHDSRNLQQPWSRSYDHRTSVLLQNHSRSSPANQHVHSFGEK